MAYTLKAHQLNQELDKDRNVTRTLEKIGSTGFYLVDERGARVRVRINRAARKLEFLERGEWTEC